MEPLPLKDLESRIWPPLSSEEQESPTVELRRYLDALELIPKDDSGKKRNLTPLPTSLEAQPPGDELSNKQHDLEPFLKKIALCHKTPFQKRVLLALCQVPPGQYTTYGIMSKHLSSSPRAVGNALRNNPFAPQVPCHRVLASGGSIGGFHGSWGRNGKDGLNDGKKRKLLRDEGVKFDGKGKVVGRPWDSFK